MSKARSITQTAAFVALIAVVQFMTAPLGQMVTGSCVNFILIVACLLGTVKIGINVAVISPFFAKLFGIGTPFLPIVPLIACANVMLVGVFAFFFREAVRLPQEGKWWLSIALGAVLKFAALALSVRIVIPLLAVPAEMAGKLFAAFGVTQLLNAFLGGVVARVAVPLICKARKVS